jgi:hypothetical protein
MNSVILANTAIKLPTDVSGEVTPLGIAAQMPIVE